MRPTKRGRPDHKPAPQTTGRHPAPRTIEDQRIGAIETVPTVREVESWATALRHLAAHCLVALGVLNGQRATVALHAPGTRRPGAHPLSVEFDDGTERNIAVHSSGFIGQAGQKEAERAGRSGRVGAATFAQATTVHTARRSQWNDVLVVDESRSLDGMERLAHRELTGDEAAAIHAHISARRWPYTVVPRAAKRVVLIRKGGAA